MVYLWERVVPEIELKFQSAEYLQMTCFAGSSPTFGGGESFQPRDRRTPGGSPPPPGATGDIPSPEGGSASDWEFIIDGGVKRSTVRVWRDIKNPRYQLLPQSFGRHLRSCTVGVHHMYPTLGLNHYWIVQYKSVNLTCCLSPCCSEALGFAFGDLVYASDPESQSSTRLTLNSGQQMVIETTGTGITQVRLGILLHVCSTRFMSYIIPFNMLNLYTVLGFVLT